MVKYFNALSLHANPIVCNCNNSQRLITDSKSILTSYSYLLNTNQAVCMANNGNPYYGKIILHFDTCESNIG